MKLIRGDRSVLQTKLVFLPFVAWLCSAPLCQEIKVRLYGIMRDCGMWHTSSVQLSLCYTIKNQHFADTLHPGRTSTSVSWKTEKLTPVHLYYSYYLTPAEPRSTESNVLYKDQSSAQNASCLQLNLCWKREKNDHVMRKKVIRLDIDIKERSQSERLNAIRLSTISRLWSEV